VTAGPSIGDEHLLGGITGSGASGSAAAQVERCGAHLNVLAVTDSRLLFLAHDGAVEYRTLLALDGGAILGAGSRPTLGQRGRLELRFRDGSAISLMAGMLSRRAAMRLLAGIAAQRTR
jgi:hypothetical protein